MRRLRALLACWIVAGEIAPAQTPAAARHEQAVTEFVEKARRARDGAIEELQFMIRGLQSGARPSRNRQRELRTTQRMLADLQQRQALVTPTLDFPPGVGGIGRLPEASIHVEKVLDARTAMVRTVFREPVVETARGRARLIQVDLTVHLRLEGVDTAGWQVGEDRPWTDCVEITAVDEAPSGRLTEALLHVRPFDIEQVRQRILSR